MKHKDDYKSKNGSFLHNCLTALSNEDVKNKRCLFKQLKNGDIVACLNGYAIIPIEQYYIITETDVPDDMQDKIIKTQKLLDAD